MKHLEENVSAIRRNTLISKVEIESNNDMGYNSKMPLSITWTATTTMPSTATTTSIETMVTTDTTTASNDFNNDCSSGNNNFD